MIEFIDTHCHIHEANYELDGDDSVRAMWLKANKPDPDAMIREANENGVSRMLCVGTSVEDSELAVQFVHTRPNTWASIGIHPHEAKHCFDATNKLQNFRSLLDGTHKIVAIGECGLDYYYNHSGKDEQKKILKFQIELALEHNLPMIFHVREAFDDFWAILDDFGPIRGVVHSFTANSRVLDQTLSRGLYVGLNGIMTFTKDQTQLATAKVVPLDRLLLETDAPFLTPVPYRGKICEPKYVRLTAEFLSELRGEPLEELAAATTQNGKELFQL
jgi:TatD DNase family protein